MGIYKGSHVISNNEISGGSSYFWIGRSFDRDYDVVVIGSGSTVISGNKITGNTLGIGSSEFTQVVNAVIANNIIYGCGAGISVSAGEASTLTIEGNLITNNTGNGIAVSGNILKPIEGNLITNNGIGLRISPGAQVTIQKNTIVNNSIGISTGSDLATISNNNIQNVNDNLQLQQGTAKNIDVTNNWWGTTDTTLIGQSIFDNKNDFNLGIANFIPFLTAPNPEAPTMDYKPTTTTPITDTSPSPEQSSSNVTETSPEPPSIPNQNSTLPEPPLKSPDQPLDQQTDPWTSERQLYETVIAALIATVGALIVAICFALRKRR
jgi:hypothetical protein